MKYLPIAILTALSMVGCDNPNTTSDNNSLKSQSTTTAVDRDNSAVNQRDRESSTKTPFDQNENKNDIDITAGIRKRVVATQMSTNAQNVKIITQDGRVTLRGPVASAEEKSKIEEIARAVAGDKNVDSQLEVE